MFTKMKPTKTGNVKVTKYEKVIDWDAVWGACFVGAIILIALASCGG